MSLRRAVVPLGVLLTVLFTVVTAGQGALLVVLLPRMPELMAGDPPEWALLGWMMVTIGILGLLCVQVVIVCTGRLLLMVARDRIFSVGSLPWVDAIVWAVAVAWALALCATYPVFAVAEADDAPGLAALQLLLLLVGAAVGLLLVVMRALLHQATTLRTDLEAVI